MADNINVTPGTGKIIAADEISGVLHQRVKLTIGSDGIDDGDVASTNPLPVTGTVAATNAGITSIDGKITACNTGAVVLAAGTAGIGKLTANSGVDIGDVDVTSIAAGDNNIGNVDIVTMPAVTGAVTANPTKLPTTDDSDFVRKYYTNAGAVTDGIVWSPASGKRWYITDLIVNTSAAATITFEDDKAGGDDPVLKLELAANGGLVSNFKTPLASGEDAADLLVTTTAGNIYITCIGYEV